MQKPTDSQRTAARRLLAREAKHAGSAEERATAGRRVYEKLVAHLGVLIGASAARALFVRSVKLTAPEFPKLAAVLLAADRDDGLGESLVQCLDQEAPDAVTETLVALYARLLALLGTLIGEALTAKVLRDSQAAFPSPPKETK